MPRMISKLTVTTFAGCVVVAAACGRARDAGAGAKDSVEANAVSRSDPSLELLTCTPGPRTMCLRDTAYVQEDAYSADIYPTANWLYFAEGGDSIEVRTIPPGNVVTSISATGTAAHPTGAAPPQRLAKRGVLRIQVILDQNSSDTVPYTLRIQQSGVRTPTVIHAAGKTATLSIASTRETDRFSIVPVSVARSVGDRAEWSVSPGTYKVVLVADSLYEVCRVPCSAPDTVTLTPSARVTKSY